MKRPGEEEEEKKNLEKDTAALEINKKNSDRERVRGEASWIWTIYGWGRRSSCLCLSLCRSRYLNSNGQGGDPANAACGQRLWWVVGGGWMHRMRPHPCP